LLSFVALALAVFFYFPQKNRLKAFCLSLIAFLFIFPFVKEPHNYKIDSTKGWEYIPGHYAKDSYELVLSQWSPLGRTHAYRFLKEEDKKAITQSMTGTFEINVEPPPEFLYFSPNYLAGTPVYNLSAEGLAKQQSKIKLFSKIIETPYLLVQDPKVVIIGTGGGRDIFLANIHGATEVVGAEINPVIHKEMSPRGRFYEYSGGVYASKNTKIYNVDGRHLVKTLKPNEYDLVVLNGVDTFSGLSSGAYAYAESYLYTRNAVIDYLRILKDNGIINFNRWYFEKWPREDLKLEVIIMGALKTLGVEKPWEHLFIGTFGTCMILVKKTPFTPQERAVLSNYFKKDNKEILYPTVEWETKGEPKNYFEKYIQAFMGKKEKVFLQEYPYDVSSITDDNPFFYKYYKLSSYNPLGGYDFIHTGNVIFLTQIFILAEAFFFIFLFIFVPLWVAKRKKIRTLSNKALGPLVLYFSCLGLGFMLIEISLMQRFTLLLGSPIHSISVVLAILLISTGLGSYLLPFLKNLMKTEKRSLRLVTFLLILQLALLIMFGSPIFEQFMAFPFFGRIMIIALVLLPMGICLGVFFPAGLLLMQRQCDETYALAWGLNCGFSVLGSILAIIIAQFLGFNFVTLLACIVYILALAAYHRLSFYFT